MANRHSDAMVRAIRLVLAGKTPYAAAQAAQVHYSTMYRSSLYKMFRDGKLDELRKAIDPNTPRPRKGVKRPSKKLSS
jgi:hypothetical protein